MSFLSNVKYKYQTKILYDLLESNHKDFIETFQKLRKDKELYFTLASKYLPPILSKNEIEVCEPKIVWLNSFLSEDISYIKNFLHFYLQKTKNINEDIQEIADKFLQIQNHFSINEKIDFNKFVQYSLLYQWLLLDIEEKDFHVVQNSLPFFSSDGGYNFSNPKLTKCYFYVIDHPYSAFAKMKKKLNGDSDQAKQLMFNTDGQNIIQSNENKNFCPVQQPWHIHLSSWQDPNVVDSLKGQIIQLKDILSNPLDTLSSVVFHLIQSGLSLDMKYDVVEEFIQANKPEDQISVFDNDDISNHEKKFIKNFIKGYDFSLFDI